VNSGTVTSEKTDDEEIWEKLAELSELERLRLQLAKAEKQQEVYNHLAWRVMELDRVVKEQGEHIESLASTLTTLLGPGKHHLVQKHGYQPCTPRQERELRERRAQLEAFKKGLKGINPGGHPRHP
jgi:hypothetical protein